MTCREAISSYLPAVVLFGGWLLAVIILMFRKRWVLAAALGCFWLLVVAIALPGLKPAWPEAKKNACLNNMELIQEAKAAWALENNKSPSDGPTEAELEKYLKHGFPRCPIDNRSYRIGKVNELPVCPNANERGHVLRPSK